MPSLVCQMNATLACVVTLVLLSACAARAPQYEVGTQGKRESRNEAERTYADQVPKVAHSGALDSPPRVLSSRFPDYPQHWINAAVVSNMTVQFTIETDGSVSNPAVLGTPRAELAALSLHAIMQWKFAPATKGGVPVQVRAQQAFVFRTE